MRVLFWSELFWPHIGGAEYFGATVLPALSERGHQFVVVTCEEGLDLPRDDVFEGIPIHRLPFRKAIVEGDLDLLARLRREVIRIKEAFAPDVIHVNGITPSVIFHLQTESVNPAPLLLRMNQEILPTEGCGPETLSGRVLNAAAWVACVSSGLREQICGRIRGIDTRSSVVYTGVRETTQAELPPLWPPQILCLGRLVPAKGFDLALRAVAAIGARFPDVRLVIAGDGAARPDLERLAMALDVEDAVHFAGWVQPARVPAILAEASVVLIPSRREGLPIAGIQASLAGRPIIGSRVTGLSEIVDHETTGLLVEKEDWQGLADALAFLLENPGIATQMGQAAHDSAVERFDWGRCVAAYDQLYRKLGDGGRCD